MGPDMKVSGCKANRSFKGEVYALPKRAPYTRDGLRTANNLERVEPFTIQVISMRENGRPISLRAKDY